MALLAQQRRLDLQHLLVVRAVGVVAVQAVLAHRRVLPQERAALLGVAGVAVLVDRGLQQHLVVGRAVRVVAARALQLALAHRHVAGAEQLGLLLQVAARAQDHLRLAEQRLRATSPLGCASWQATQEMFRLSCVEPIQCFWSPLLWHSMQIADESTALRVLKMRIFVLSPPPSTCAWPGPWQPSQPCDVPGVRRVLERLGRRPRGRSRRLPSP